MRERLIELIKNGIEEHQSKVTEDIRKTVYNNHRDNSKTDNICDVEETLTDYLLQNGVAVLSCKVGDVVYCLYQPPKEETRIAEVEIDTFEIHKGYIVIVGYDKHDNEGFCYRYFTREIGKTVFLTKEEAEKALERSKNNGFE